MTTDPETKDSGWIVPNEFRRLTPNRYAATYLPKRIEPISLVVYHYTAGGLHGALRWLTQATGSMASAHFVVGRLGAVYQLAPLTDRTWHAGGKTSTWRGRGQVNNRSFGIELENWGPVTRSPDGTWQTHNGLPYRGEVVPVGADKIEYWAAYPEPQRAALQKLVKTLVERFPVLQDRARHVGHSDVDPARKRDPGPAFPWSIVESAILDVVTEEKRRSP